jgi:putative NADH-flavin reductase
VKILIIGATGGTGRILLDKALEQGHQVTALARNPSAVAPRDYRPRVLWGNALDPEAVGAAVAGQDAVLSVLGTRSRKPTTLFSASTANLVDTMKKHGVRRLVCLTGIGAGEYQVFLSGDSYRATTISREDVSAFILAQLSEDRYLHQMPVISY